MLLGLGTSGDTWVPGVGVQCKLCFSQSQTHITEKARRSQSCPSAAHYLCPPKSCSSGMQGLMGQHQQHHLLPRARSRGAGWLSEAHAQGDPWDG